MHIRRDVLEAITAHARQEHPRECCGILISAGGEVVEAVAAANTADDPLRCYQVSPADHIAQIKRCRESAARRPDSPLQIAGVYHSHPHSAPVPSPTDRDQAYPEYLYVIVGPADGSTSLEVRAYRLDAEGFVEVQLTPTPAADAG
jgi:proteasome lid subunit RPN8/RPN11